MKLRSLLTFALLAVGSLSAAGSTITPITIGTPNAGGGDTLPVAFGKVNTNFSNLNAEIANVPHLAGPWTITGVYTYTVAPVFQVAPVYGDPAGTRAALGLGSASIQPASAFDAAGAATAAQAVAVQRSNHTGTQTSSTISDFSAAASAAAPVQSVAGRAGAVTLTKTDVGLGNVNNIAVSPLAVGAIQTANTTLVADTILPFNAAGGSLVASMPTSPTVNMRVALKKVDSTTNTVSVTARFNGSATATTLALRLADQAKTYVYSPDGTWYPVAGDVTLTSLDARYGPLYTVEQFGAKGDERMLLDAGITSGATTLSSASAGFSSADVGKVVSILGAGSSGAGLTTTISAYISSTSVTLSTAAGTTVSNAHCDYGTDDTVAIQSAINAATATGGTAQIVNKSYLLTSALTINNAMALRGTGAMTLYGSLATNVEAVNVPILPPYLGGSVLVQTAANAHVLYSTAQGVSVDIRDFGIRFASGIQFKSTGNGFYGYPPPLDTSYQNSGSMAARWDDVPVFGTDGNHYAFWIVNPLQLHASHLSGFGGGGLCVETNGEVGKNNLLGNCQFDRPYFNTFVAGSAHAYCLKNTSGETILMTFVGPQSWVKDETSTGLVSTLPNSTQKTFYVDPTALSQGTGTSRWLNIIAPDFETNVSGVSYTIPNAAGIFLGPGLINDYSSGTNTAVEYILMGGGFQIYQGTLSYNGNIVSTQNVWASPGGVAKPAGASPGDLIGTRNATTGAIYLGGDGLGFIYRSGNILALGPLPTTNPHVATAWWNNGGVVSVSTGP